MASTAIFIGSAQEAWNQDGCGCADARRSRRERRRDETTLGLERVLDLHDLATAVVAAVAAGAVRELALAAVRTHRRSRGGQSVVRAALVAAGLRMASLGIRHLRLSWRAKALTRTVICAPSLARFQSQARQRF